MLSEIYNKFPFYAICLWSIFVGIYVGGEYTEGVCLTSDSSNCKAESNQMHFRKVPLLVKPQWLNEILCSEKLPKSTLRVIDCSWMPNTNTRKELFARRHIPHAGFLDLNDCIQPSPLIPRALPSPPCFQRTLRNLGISKDTHVIVYDQIEGKSAARLWWMLQVFGHYNVSVLDGGIRAWTKSGFKVSKHTADSNEGNIMLSVRRAELKTYEDMIRNLELDEFQVLDARSKIEFSGEHGDSDKNVLRGHIPGAFNIPFTSLYNSDGTFRSRDELRKLFQKSKVDITRPMVSMCYTGMTACGLALAARHALDLPDIPVYYGSWYEYSRRALPSMTIKDI